MKVKKINVKINDLVFVNKDDDGIFVSFIKVGCLCVDWCFSW